MLDFNEFSLHQCEVQLQCIRIMILKISAISTTECIDRKTDHLKYIIFKPNVFTDFDKHKLDHPST